ncbi:MAG TPA: hypothetical protein VKT80_17980 [Chloroflexota bacterium]|nr:hypothetical protein [Chloroflexota bacterium]
MVARCVFWLLVGALLVILFIFARKRFRQVVLIGGLSIAAGAVIRLITLRSSDQSELVSEAYFLIAIGVLYGLVWLATRYLGNRPRSSTPGPPKR